MKRKPTILLIASILAASAMTLMHCGSSAPGVRESKRTSAKSRKTSAKSRKTCAPRRPLVPPTGTKQDLPPAEWDVTDPLFSSEVFRPRLLVRVSHKDYPRHLACKELPPVRITVALMVSAEGKIRDVRIINMSSRGSAHAPYFEDFARVTRHIFLNKARIISKPLLVNGKPSPYVWTTTMVFRLQ